MAAGGFASSGCASGDRGARPPAASFDGTGQPEVDRRAAPAVGAAVAGSTREPDASAFFDSDGLRIHYEVFGEGRPIILVHGWGADLRRNWVETGWVAALRPLRRVIALDVRGHGASSKPHDRALYSYETMARDVAHLMDHLHIEKADLFGYSMGAFMAAHLLGHERRRFSSVVMGGIGDETDESKDATFIAQALRAKSIWSVDSLAGLGVRLFVAADPRNDFEALAVSALRMWPEGYPLQLGGPGLAEVDAPVLIVDGADDAYARSAPRLAAAIPGARLVTIPGADHLSVVSDGRFKEAVTAFLRGQR
jgi:pimeloyl-ACP methyl ester carboxylesterase